MDFMRRKLFRYMLLLALLLTSAAVAGLFFLGRFSDSRREIHESLGMQLSVFEKEIKSHAENTAAMGLQMSEKLSALLEMSLEEQKISFRDLTDSAADISALQDVLFEPLQQFLLQTDCSGAFIVLNATVNSFAENAEHSRTGIFLELGGNSVSQDVLLYRGIARVGKKYGVFPHRKWRLEFRTDSFPDFQESMAAADLPAGRNYRFSSLFTLPGTSERAALLTFPLAGRDGSVYGLCGFEISEDLFKKEHAQSSKLQHLTCLLAAENGETVKASQVLSCGVADGYYLAPNEDLKIEGFYGGMLAFSGEKHSYVGIRRSAVLSPLNHEFMLAVMIPREDYDRLAGENMAEFFIFILLLAFFAVSVSLFFSRRYLSPILQEMEQIKAGRQEAAEEAFRMRQDFERIAPAVRDEIDEDSYRIFKENLTKLTPKEHEVFNLYFKGHSSGEILEIEGFSINALKYHNKNIYSKLGVSSRKELLRYITLMQHNY